MAIGGVTRVSFLRAPRAGRCLTELQVDFGVSRKLLSHNSNMPCRRDAADGDGVLASIEHSLPLVKRVSSCHKVQGPATCELHPDGLELLGFSRGITGEKAQRVG